MIKFVSTKTEPMYVMPRMPRMIEYSETIESVTVEYKAHNLVSIQSNNADKLMEMILWMDRSVEGEVGPIERNMEILTFMGAVEPTNELFDRYVDLLIAMDDMDHLAYKVQWNYPSDEDIILATLRWAS